LIILGLQTDIRFGCGFAAVMRAHVAAEAAGRDPSRGVIGDQLRKACIGAGRLAAGALSTAGYRHTMISGTHWCKSESNGAR
jgi:hypothetical protein